MLNIVTLGLAIHLFFNFGFYEVQTIVATSIKYWWASKLLLRVLLLLYIWRPVYRPISTLPTMNCERYQTSAFPCQMAITCYAYVYICMCLYMYLCVRGRVMVSTKRIPHISRKRSAPVWRPITVIMNHHQAEHAGKPATKGSEFIITKTMLDLVTLDQ